MFLLLSIITKVTIDVSFKEMHTQTVIVGCMAPMTEVDKNPGYAATQMGVWSNISSLIYQAYQSIYVWHGDVQTLIYSITDQKGAGIPKFLVNLSSRYFHAGFHVEL